MTPLPHNIELERGVLGSAMLDSEVMTTCLDLKVTRDTFFLPAHKVIWDIMTDVFAESPASLSSIQVLNALISRTAESLPWLRLARKIAGKPLTETLIDCIGGRAFFFSVADCVETSAQAEHWIPELVEKSNRRKLIEISREIINKASNSDCAYSQVIGHAESQLLSLSSGKETTMISSPQFAESAYERAETVRNRPKGQLVVPGAIPSGLIDLDRRTGGFQPHEMVVFAARPSMGKTAAATLFCEKAAMAGSPTLVFSIEMSAEQWGLRQIFSMAGVNYERWKDNIIGHEDFLKVEEAKNRLATLPIWIEEAADLTISQIRAKARRMKMLHGIKFIILDYLQIVTGEKGHSSREQEVCEISRNIKNMAKELDTAVLALAQVNRESEKRGANSFLRSSDLRESGSIEQDADLIILNNPTKIDSDTKKPVPGGKHLWDLAKNRNGPTGVIPVTFQIELTRFMNYSHAD